MRGARLGGRPRFCRFGIGRKARGGGFSLADKINDKPKPATPLSKRLSEPQMGQALRSVYQKTVEEAVPDEFLDLLSKLD